MLRRIITGEARTTNSVDHREQLQTSKYPHPWKVVGLRRLSVGVVALGAHGLRWWELLCTLQARILVIGNSAVLPHSCTEQSLWYSVSYHVQASHGLASRPNSCLPSLRHFFWSCPASHLLLHIVCSTLSHQPNFRLCDLGLEGFPALQAIQR